MACPCAGCQGTAGVQEVLVPLDKAARLVILQGLDKLEFGFASEVAERLRATLCDQCRGTGYAPYVGGDDDEDRCGHCHGHGFKEKRLF